MTDFDLKVRGMVFMLGVATSITVPEGVEPRAYDCDSLADVLLLLLSTSTCRHRSMLRSLTKLYARTVSNCAKDTAAAVLEELAFHCPSRRLNGRDIIRYSSLTRWSSDRNQTQRPIARAKIRGGRKGKLNEALWQHCWVARSLALLSAARRHPC
jgi:hypothetical protein